MTASISPLRVLTAEFAEISQKIADAETDEAREALLVEFLKLDQDINTKVEGCVVVSKRLESDAEECRRIAREATERARRLEARADWLLNTYLKRNMEALGEKKVETPLYTASVALNPRAVEITDEKAIPGMFLVQKTTYAVDKVAVKRAIEGGQEVPGARLVQGSRLVVS